VEWLYSGCRFVADYVLQNACLTIQAYSTMHGSSSVTNEVSFVDERSRGSMDMMVSEKRPTRHR